MMKIQYYAYAGRPKLRQMLITVKDCKIVKQEFTGKVYDSVTEANKDVWKLNCKNGQFGVK